MGIARPAGGREKLRARRRAGIPWPDGKDFAFTIFDDPDGQDEATSRRVYDFLSDLGYRTTIGVWPLAPRRAVNSGGETCQGNPSYLSHCERLQREGFEIGYHCATPHDSTREEIIESLNLFSSYFGHDPVTMANHYNSDAMYWGPVRLTGIHQGIYQLLTLGKTRGRFFGHIESHPSFWGDICRNRIGYCRNLVFTELNTLGVCPQMPYYDPIRPHVRAWYSSADGNQRPAFVRVIRESAQDELVECGGAAIVYTHFGHGFVENNKLFPRFVELMTRLRRQNGWFVPVGTLLDYLAARNGIRPIDPSERTRMERRWLFEKLFHGTS